MRNRKVVIVSACRTPIGEFMGQFKDVPARELAITAAHAALARIGLDAKQVDELVMGEVFCAMQGSLPARQVSMRIGMNPASGALSVNQNCASGMRALEIVSNDILLGKAEIGLAVGVESMTQAPFLLPKARMGYHFGSVPDRGRAELYDSLICDGLHDELSDGHMGATAETVAKRYQITRQECDEFALLSHRRASEATASGKFKREVVPVAVRKGKQTLQIDTDEHILHDCTEEYFSRFKPAFAADGVVTIANSSGINDGASAAVLMSAEKALELGLRPMAELVGCGTRGIEPEIMGLGPAVAIPAVLRSAGVDFQDIDYWEINEAFAAQFIGVRKKLQEDCGYAIDVNCVNANGSGISLGHPVGSTGLRLIVTMLYEMERRNAMLGCASLCVGGGPAIASVWSRRDL